MTWAKLILWMIVGLTLWLLLIKAAMIIAPFIPT